MINEKMYGLGDEPSAIRELFAYGMARKAEIGAENVFDFCIGNPQRAGARCREQTMLELLDEEPVPFTATRRRRAPAVKEAMAAYPPPLRHDGDAEPGVPDGRCRGGLGLSIAAVTEPGDEVVVSRRRYFPEYRTWIETAGCTAWRCRQQFPTSSPTSRRCARPSGRRRAAVIINSPNNPVGAVYTRENLEALAALLARKEDELGRKLYVISDEPYREITYGAEVPYVPCVWPRTIVCYSYSKSLSLPGERIGYMYVSDLMDDAAEVSTAVAGAGRALGLHLRAGAVPARDCRAVSTSRRDVAAYAENRRPAYRGPRRAGLRVRGAATARSTCGCARLRTTPRRSATARRPMSSCWCPPTASAFGGWVRVSYCVSRDTIERSMPAFKALKESYEAKLGS